MYSSKVSDFSLAPRLKILNDCTGTSAIASGDCNYGQIPKEHWFQPAWINETRASEARADLVAKEILYGGSVPYRSKLISFISDSDPV